jgi:glyoxylase-like metal-dependent hydrolase (beta-lactamase superfamily II)
MTPSPERRKITIDCDITAGFTASYLRIEGSECAFIETHTALALPRLLKALSDAGRKPEDVRWVVVTHAHLDHAAGAGALLAVCPNATLLAHPRAARHLVQPEKLIKSATAVYGEKRFAELYGAITPIPADRARALEDGATFELGAATLRVVHTAGHANHHFAVDDPAADTVFTGDTFGLVYPALQGRGRFVFPSTSPTNFDAAEARKSIDRVLGLGRSTVSLTHFDTYADKDEIATQLRRWIDRSEAWLNEAAAGDATVDAMTKHIETEIRAAIEQEVTARDLGFDDTAWRTLALDIELNAQGIAFVADQKRKAS